MRASSIEAVTILYCLPGFIMEAKKNTPSWEHLINLRWYEKSEWISFADAKAADGATWERGQERGWRLITDFHFYF